MQISAAYGPDILEDLKDIASCGASPESEYVGILGRSVTPGLSVVCERGLPASSISRSRCDLHGE